MERPRHAQLHRPRRPGLRSLGVRNSSLEQWPQLDAGQRGRACQAAQLRLPQLGSVGGVVVAFLDSATAFGRAMARPGTPSPAARLQPVTLAGDGTGLWALTGGRNFNGGADSPVQVWVTSDGAHWTNSAQLPNSQPRLRTSQPPSGRPVASSSAVRSRGIRRTKSTGTWRTNTPTLTQKGRVSSTLQSAMCRVSSFRPVAYPPGCVFDPAQSAALPGRRLTARSGGGCPRQDGWAARSISCL